MLLRFQATELLLEVEQIELMGTLFNIERWYYPLATVMPKRVYLYLYL